MLNFFDIIKLVIYMSEVEKLVVNFKKRYRGGIAWRIRKHARVVESYLNPGEKVLYAFCAQKNETFKEIFNTYAIAITNKRIMLGHKRLIWGNFYYTITPEMYNDMEIYRGLIWGKLTIDTIKEVIVLTNLPKKSLRKIETVISEFMMEEKKKYKHEKEEK